MKNLSSLFRKDNLDEIVFTNRNKSYGAYALRNDYSHQLTKAVYIGVAFFASLSVMPLIISAFDVPEITEVVPPAIPFVLKPIDTPETPKPKPASTVPQDVKTVASPVYTPVRDVKKDTPVPTVDDFKGAAIGNETKKGPETNMTVAPPVIVAGPPSVSPPYVAPVKVEDPNKILDPGSVDVAADFKGGINAFREKVAQNFDTEAVDKGGMVSAVITFVVETNGSISNLKINGSNADFNSEAERAIKAIKSKWTPAQLKGKAVRSSFRMPISMKIE